MQIKTKIFLVSALFLIGNSAFAQTGQIIEAYGLNTVAGYSTVLRSSQALPNTDLVFNLKKPSSEIIPIEAKTNLNGVAIADVSDYYTRQAGTYYVSVYPKGGNVSTSFNSFEVYANDVSETQSLVFPSDQVVRSATERAYVNVQLLDNYKNPIQGHLVKLIPSNSNSKISSVSDISDNLGQMKFEVSSSASGAVSYSVYDVTADKLLEKQSKVLYFTGSASIFEKPKTNYSYYASVLSIGGPADSLKFENLSTVIHPGDNASVTVKAYDASNQLATDYKGTVRFSVIGDNAQFANIPDDYTFTALDQGSHVFSLAFSFQQIGNYQIKVTDLANIAIFGEQTFSVTAASSADLPTTSGIVIKNPITGSTSSSNVQVITGTAAPGSKLKIYDNDIEIGSLIADIAGSFSHTTGVLIAGQHQFYVASVNDAGIITNTSQPVTVTIDTEPPEISQILVEPSGSVDPSTPVKVKLFTDDQLSKAAMVLQGSINEMSMTNPGVYEVTVAAPVEFGQYPLDFVLTDSLGNESNVKNQGTISVGKLSAPETVIANTSNLVATPGDGRITLNWTAPQGATTPIKNYRVHYGISPNQLSEAVDTLTNATTWYIPNLQNGVTYYFAVIPVDQQGKTPKTFNQIVPGTPNPPVVATPPPSFIFGADGAEALDDMEEDASKSGPEMLWLVVLSAFGGIFYCQARKKRLDC